MGSKLPRLAHDDQESVRLQGGTAFFDACLGAFQGGGCRAAAYVGGIRAAETAGVRFTELAGSSAGALVAALLGAGATADRLETLVLATPLNTLLSPPLRPAGLKRQLISTLGRIARRRALFDALAFGGAHATDALRTWVNDKLADLLPEVPGTVRFRDLLIPTWVIATDLESRGIVVWSTDTTPDIEVAEAVVASCALPFFFQPVQGRYVDGGALSNLPAFVYSRRVRRTTDRVLAFTLHAKTASRPVEPMGPWNAARERVKTLSETITDGSVHLQLQLQPEVSVIEIPTQDVRATDFARMNREVIGNLINAGEDATRRFFQNELHAVRAGGHSLRDSLSREETLASVTSWASAHAETVCIAARESSWVFELLPLLLHWRNEGVRVRALLPPPHHGSTSTQYQYSLLSSLGVEVASIQKTITGMFILNGDHPAISSAIVNTDNPGMDAMIYSAATGDSNVISALARQFEADWPEDGVELTKPNHPLPTLHGVGEREIIDILMQAVPMYRDAELRMGWVPISSLVPLARTVPLFKYRQAQVWPQLYQQAGLGLYEPATIDFGSGQSFVGPPVVEESGGRFYIVQGAARALRAQHCRDVALRCMVVRGASEPLPAAPQDLRRLRVVVDTGQLVNRFDQFDYSRFRPIESSLHTMPLLSRPVSPSSTTAEREDEK